MRGTSDRLMTTHMSSPFCEKENGTRRPFELPGQDAALVRLGPSHATQLV